MTFLVSLYGFVNHTPFIKIIYIVDCLLENLVYFLDFEFHAVMSYQNFFLLFCDSLHINISHIIFQNKCFNDLLVLVFLQLNIILCFFNSPEILLQFLQTARQQLMVLTTHIILCLKSINFFFQILLLLQSLFPPSPSNFTFHQLDLIFCIVQQFLLTLEFLV
jgi:hypothetical protein